LKSFESKNPIAVTGKLCFFWPIKICNEFKSTVFMNPSLLAMESIYSFLEGFILVTALL
jgi:hypothetical protein